MRVATGLIASLIAHLTLLIFLAKLPPPFRLNSEEPIQIEIVSPDPKPETAVDQHRTKNKQIVTQTLVPQEQLQKKEDPTLAELLSQKQQRVKKQMKARENGLTRNMPNPQRLNESKMKKSARPNQNMRELARQVLKQEKLGLREKNYADPDSSEFPTRNSKDTRDQISDNSNQLPAPVVSTISENISDSIEFGSMTALNTDSYLYYSFFARVQELVRFRWTSRVEVARELMDPYFMRNVVQSRDWTTYLDIWLRPDGSFHSAHIMKESGIVALDRAGVMAFKEVQIFSNPPQELVEDDGFIHLRYNLTVRFRHGL